MISMSIPCGCWSRPSSISPAAVISHDRFFLDRISTHLLIFEGDGKTRWFEGNFRAYEESLAAGDPDRMAHRRGKYKPLRLR